MKLLGVVWTVWKVTAKRFGPVGGFVAAALVVTVYLSLKRWFRSK